MTSALVDDTERAEDTEKLATETQRHRERVCSVSLCLCGFSLSVLRSLCVVAT